MFHKIILVIVIIISYILYNIFFSENFVSEGVPLQTSTEVEKFMFKGYDLEPLYNYQLEAKILSKKKYSSGQNSKLSLYDLALGWKDMSNDEVLSEISISQSNRWYYWRTNNFPIPRKNIETQSSNHHIIHANDEIKEIVSDMDEGDTVILKGYLVEVTLPGDSYNWKSSTSRNDTGDGACEVFYVNDAFILKDN